MRSISRRDDSPSTQLLTRILERPGLVAAVRELPGRTLGQLIERIGLEDAGELVALASSAQLERIFDDDLWSAERPADDETFRPARFALWLRVMQEAGEELLVQRLCELPQDLLALAVHRTVLVLDMDVVAEQLGWAGEEGAPIESALESSTFEEWEEFRVIARDRDAWDDVWSALLALDRDHHDRLRAILAQCCAMSTEYISGQGGLFQVLTSAEMLESDVTAARDDRRSAEGFVTPADARAFLEHARRRAGEDERDPITRAYLRELAGPTPERSRREPVTRPLERSAAALADTRDLEVLLGDAGVLASPAARAYVAAPLFEQAMSDLQDHDPELFSTRVREVGYLVNVWIAGGVHEGRRPRPIDALETVLKMCEAGLRLVGPVSPAQALAALARTPADVLFRRGFRSGG